MTRLILLLLIGLAVAFLIWVLTNKIGFQDDQKDKNKNPDDNSPEDHPGIEAQVTVNQIDTISAVAQLPVWFNHEPTEKNPAIYEDTYWEIEPFGEYIYYLAGDYAKNNNGRLNYTSPSIVFSVLATMESDSIEVTQHDGGREQELAEKSTIDVDDLLPKSVGDVINSFRPLLEENPDNTQLTSLKQLMPEGADGNARLLVSKNWINNAGLKVTLLYEEFRAGTNPNESERLVTIQAHCMSDDQPLAPLMEHFINLVNRYKSMPYLPLSGATRY